MKRKIKLAAPFIILFFLFSLLGKELLYAQPNNRTSALIGESLPSFSVPNLLQPDKTFSDKDLKGKVIMLNVWATWCYACLLEHPMLMRIKEQYHIPMYSIVYKDDANSARHWLKDNGNPFIASGNDKTGNVAIDFGVYGTPETFLINRSGKIIYRHVGMLDQRLWEREIYPLIVKYNR